MRGRCIPATLSQARAVIRPAARPPSVLSPAALAAAPELAFFDALEALLDVTYCALVAADPALDDPERPYWLREPLPSTHQPASRITMLIADLRQQMDRYRRLARIETERPHDDTIPF
jgi:hypothetical protein